MTKLPNEIETHGRVCCSGDWNGLEVHLYRSDTNSITTYPNFETMAEKNPNIVLFLESTAESYKLDRRKLVLDAFAKYGVEAWTFKTQYTGKYRKMWKLGKTDVIDAKLIYRIATETKMTLKRFGELRRNDPLTETITRIILDRPQGSKESHLEVKTQLSRVIAPKEYNSYLLTTTKKYRAPIGRILMLAKAVREAGRGRREFERQLGSSGQGKRGIMRSEFYYHWVRPIAQSILKSESTKKIYMKSMTPKQEVRFREINKEVMHMADKVAYWLWKTTEVEKEMSVSA